MTQSTQRNIQHKVGLLNLAEELVGCADSKYTQRIVLINCLYGRRNYIPFKWCR